MALSKTTIRTGVGGVLAAAAVAGMADPALAATYSIVQGTATFVAGNTQISPSTAFDDISITLSTVSAPPYRLPFPIKMWGQTSSTLYVNSNGVASSTLATTSWTNTCLPAPLGRAVAAYWDDIYFNRPTYGVDGIFTKTYGSAPNRKFLVAWRGREFANPLKTIRAEVIFTENSNNVETRHAEGNGANATTGLQKTATGPALVYSCNSGTTVTPPGKRLLYRWS